MLYLVIFLFALDKTIIDVIIFKIMNKFLFLDNIE